MARGWESKSVESQMEEAGNRDLTGPAASPTQAEIDRDHKRGGLELSRTRVRNDLASCRNPRYRTVLEAALDHLDRELQALD